MSTAVLNHGILPRRFLTPPTPTPTPTPTLSSSVNLKLLEESKGRFHHQLPPLLSTHNNLSYRLQKRNSPIASCLSSSPPPRARFNPSTRIFVSGLSFRTSEESLRNAFKNFGELEEVNLVMDKIANRPRGFAFLRYATEEESKKAIEGMHGKFLDGRVIFVEVAKPRAELRQGYKHNPKQS